MLHIINTRTTHVRTHNSCTKPRYVGKSAATIYHGDLYISYSRSGTLSSRKKNGNGESRALQTSSSYRVCVCVYIYIICIENSGDEKKRERERENPWKSTVIGD